MGEEATLEMCFAARESDQFAQQPTVDSDASAIVPALEKRDTRMTNVNIDCDCGHRFSVSLSHYEVVECEVCRQQWWALQLKRRGPLVANRRPEQQQ